VARVVIVGSGAGGGAAAWQLTRLGIDVVLIDAGPRFSPIKDYRLDQSNWEQMFPHKNGSQGAYEVAQGQSLSNVPSDLRSWNHLSGRLVKGPVRQSFGYHHVRGVGGSSLHFTGEAHRLNPKSMRMHSDYGVAHDWPFSYADLDPYWTLAEKMTGVAGPSQDLRCPRSSAYPFKAHELSFASQQMALGLKRLGMTYQPNSLAVLSEVADDRPKCNYCGGCLRGCQIGDKGSVDVTYLRHAAATGRLTLLAETEVQTVETQSDSVSALVAMSKGKLTKIAGDYFILACGAIQTPRLLLNSANSASPDGLCNESGQLGKNFMETLLWTSSGLSEDNWGAHRGLPVDWVSWDFNAPNSIPGVIGGARFGPAQAESDLVGPVAYAQRVVPGWGAAHKSTMRQIFGRAVSVAGIAESLPNSKSFVALAEKKDNQGLPLALIHSYVDKMAMDRINFMAKTTREIMSAIGVKKIFEEFSSADVFSSTHVFGTCRMSASESMGVVNPNCQSFRWPNLYIMDASIFPSSGGGESPGLTIQALALMATERLAKRIK